jgi:hypothetical protein
MPIIFRGKQAPPDHPIYSRGVSFVFRNELPPETDDSSEEQEQPPADKPDSESE